MPRYITAKQYKNLSGIPRSRMAARFKVFAGAIIEDDSNRILLVKYEKHGEVGYDLPGGRVLWNEAIADSVIREVLEESGYGFNPRKLLGIFQRVTIDNDSEYIRIIFVGNTGKRVTRKIDPSIMSVEWIPVKDILSNKIRMRSPEVIREINEYITGKGFPLEVVDTYSW